MVQADSYLKLLTPSILDMYKVFEHIDMPPTGIQEQPHTVLCILLGSQILGFWVTCRAKKTVFFKCAWEVLAGEKKTD
jgi:hypothetical protein